MKSYKNLKEKAYEIIKNKIIMIEFKPGEYLEEKVLSELLEISRTPIREALNVLENEGWIESFPRKGIFVTRIDEEKIDEIYEVRKNFDPLILKMAAKNLSPLKLNLFKHKFENYEEMLEDEFLKYDADFHSYVHSAVKNKYVLKMMKNVYEHNRRIRRLGVQKVPHQRIVDSNKEHLEMIDLILNGEIDKAADLLRKHIENSHKYYLNVLLDKDL
ncbi:DNA-binding GntR family transcriptional regulator [Hypnocyclicus thermotrophus]|uniref:DNA-binding GntR family transcriptional regulator n=1 Tax=Hypnocyclicus thermotrophus TaxID=1627895 RepID=A0AA46I6W3_9FUSO|nr:GntR family transcriptional regulator [Hypnocyclicus thermotrophus]TDT72263.1 DNA-binding GntR family transcriptional regulator [Hypnocyclicus thermotrophus]